jgi:hypothetical protein
VDPRLARLRRQASLLLVSVLAACLVSACGLLRSAVGLGAVEQGSPLIEQQFVDLTHYLDVMVIRIDEASLAFELAANDPEAEVLAAKWRLGAT